MLVWFVGCLVVVCLVWFDLVLIWLFVGLFVLVCLFCFGWFGLIVLDVFGWFVCLSVLNCACLFSCHVLQLFFVLPCFRYRGSRRTCFLFVVLFGVAELVRFYAFTIRVLENIR